MSPKKKKPKLMPVSLENKRENDTEESMNKRRKFNSSSTSDNIASLKRKNFVKACEKVSCSAYLNYAERFQLISLPDCIQSNCCKHQDFKESSKIKQVPSHAEESFKIEMKTNMWCDALEVCRLCITPTQYLSSDILKDIVEIVLNAHEDNSGEYPVSKLISQCQQILALNFSTHPPCLMKTMRKCYNNFLTTSMDLKGNTFTNRSQFDCDKGIVKYCMNRLEYEISEDSKDTPLVDKNENIPEEMKQTVKGLHWQKEKLEIFEVLERPERIERLMAVLSSVIELLQYDLAIWHSRYTNNLGSHIMRSHKPLMAYVLWANNVLYTGAVNNNCRQILKLFMYFIHLKYPEEHIRTMQLWLNTMIQTFYICETNSNTDYPNTGKYCTAFANEFYKLLSDLPPESRIRILERVEPSFMQYLIGIVHTQSLFSSQDCNIIRIVIDVLNKSQWTKFPQSSADLKLRKTFCVRNIKRNKFLKFLSNKICKETRRQKGEACILYSKYTPCIFSSQVDQNYAMCVLSITFRAYLDAYSVENVQETLDKLNKEIMSNAPYYDTMELTSYTATENFIKTYRQIYQLLKELIILLNKYHDKDQYDQILKFFENIPLLGL
ncbi:uncharacterized protein LOC121731432 [Aricia agestis]|uniref:uncharacterized protein LOC121731432 n=1 Tax=Aricia agestis TaxID=91739 RepID=UPI001C202F14|nr:uncharacterized protein LOC121731432 [Aricia agestis]